MKILFLSRQKQLLYILLADMYGTGQTRKPQKCLTAIKQTLPQPFHNIFILSFFIIQFQALYVNFSLLKMRI